MSEKVYAILTDKIIKQLEAGVVPWSKPWTQGAAWPINLSTKKFYRGYNVFSLSLTMQANGYKRNIWISLKQCNDLGGRIKKGEGHASKVLFHKVYKATETDENGETSERVRYVSPRYTPVWNVEQTEGLEEKIEALIVKLGGGERPEISEIEAGELVPQALGIPVRYTGASAYYTPTADTITMPVRDSFKSTEGFYGTLFHEIGHGTGHESRLNRVELMKSDGFGGALYSREELVAEMYSVFLASILGIVTEPKFENNAAYIKSWLTKLKDDRKILVDASRDAETAVRFTLDKLGITEYTGTTQEVANA